MWLLAKYRHALLVLLGFFSWIPIVIINLYYWITVLKNGMAAFPPGFPLWMRKAMFVAFFLINYLMMDQLVKRVQKWDVIDLLWKLLVTGTVSILVTFVFVVLEEQYADDKYLPFVKTIGVSVRLYAFVIFVLAATFVFRRLLLYQKNKLKVAAWNLFQLLAWLGLMRIFMRSEWMLTAVWQYALIPLFVIVSLVLAAYVNWSAYLSFRQKLQSLFLMFVVVLMFVAFFFRFPFEALPDAAASMAISFRYYQVPDILSGEFMVLGLLFLFPFLYALLSTLVILFNLPTSSVFEQRSSELKSLQSINYSIHEHRDINEIFRTLLDASLLSSNATGGWIERWVAENSEQGGSFEMLYVKNVQIDEIAKLKEKEDLGTQVVELKHWVHAANLRKLKNFRFNRSRFRSILVVPVMQRDQVVGILYLVNELSGSFEEATITSVTGMTEQAGYALENAELMEQSLDLQRYLEQVKIAREVQEQILPKSMPRNGEIEFYAVAQDAEEIGGDYYDVHQDGHSYQVALGDVSGKGTTAAFYMAETKGIFQALVHQNLSPEQFVLSANKALSRCFNPGSFMTLTYLQIDTEAQFVEVIRAGHCPTLYYDAMADSLHVLEAGGTGLGILRNARFEQHIGPSEKRPFRPGDLLILFTDGIIEARNKEREEFGMSRLRNMVYDLRKKDTRIIAESLLESVKRFTGGEIDDDYTILVIKRPETKTPAERST